MAIAVHLSLKGKAQAATTELLIEELTCDLSIKLDRVFLQDTNWKCFNYYLAFENYRRPIDEYLYEFDSRLFRLRKCQVNLPDAVISCRLLKNCNLTDMHFELALYTMTHMSFEGMRSTLKNYLLRVTT